MVEFVLLAEFVRHTNTLGLSLRFVDACYLIKVLNLFPEILAEKFNNLFACIRQVETKIQLLRGKTIQAHVK